MNQPVESSGQDAEINQPRPANGEDATASEQQPPTVRRTSGLTVEQLNLLATSIADALDDQRASNMQRGMTEHAREAYYMKKGVLTLAGALRAAMASQSS